jgi:hypothetical protein
MVNIDKESLDMYIFALDDINWIERKLMRLFAKEYILPVIYEALKLSKKAELSAENEVLEKKLELDNVLRNKFLWAIRILEKRD